MHRRLSALSAQLCLAAGVLMCPAHASAQSADLFFSEYIEGSSNNKALEIFNGTGTSVDLLAGGYNVQMHFNGNPAAGLTIFTFPGATDAPRNDRPPLLLRGAYVGGDAVFPITVIAVHQRSLSGIDGADGARVRAKRHAQALQLSQFIDSLQDAEPGVHLVAIGNFNAFEFTDGYVDVMGQVTGNPDPAGALLPATDEISQDLTNQTFNMPADQRYSFVFDGNAQSLDHAITTQALDPWVRGAEHSRGNADAPFSFDRTAGTSLRSSDHDGTVLFLTTDLDADSVPDTLDACADTRIPEGVPTDRLNPNHYALVDGDGLFDTTAPPGRSGRMPSFTIADTDGCSCEQILDRIGTLEAGERSFGCSLGTIRDWVEAH